MAKLLNRGKVVVQITWQATHLNISIFSGVAFFMDVVRTLSESGMGLAQSPSRSDHHRQFLAMPGHAMTTWRTLSSTTQATKPPGPRIPRVGVMKTAGVTSHFRIHPYQLIFRTDLRRHHGIPCHRFGVQVTDGAKGNKQPHHTKIRGNPRLANMSWIQQTGYVICGLGKINPRDISRDSIGCPNSRRDIKPLTSQSATHACSVVLVSDAPNGPLLAASSNSTMTSDSLRVIALISGGKDSFYSILHCMRNGHKVVALANLFPEGEGRSGLEIIEPHDASSTKTSAATPPDANLSDDDVDLNSFMYQTVGHQTIPLYAAATGLPLYRHAILGGAKYDGRDYDASQTTSLADGDETESMIPLLRGVMDRHPDANALCAGAILSTYQRTRVESVALRLGLTPLAYLWKYPVLPPPPGSLGGDDEQLLLDMASAGLEARIIKVASAGLDEEFLWQQVSSVQGVGRVKRALRRFGAAEGSVLGEGGEFETIVVDGPGVLFQKRIHVSEEGRRVIREGGGTSWLDFQAAHLEDKNVVDGDDQLHVRVPELLDPRFDSVTAVLSDPTSTSTQPKRISSVVGGLNRASIQHGSSQPGRHEMCWTVTAPNQTYVSIEDETRSLVEKIRARLDTSSLPTTAITSTIIVLKRMSDFPAINKIYGGLFEHANPPSRVTISCGDLLPQGCNVIVHMTVQTGLGAADRKGLHVQSRSYWAPANIGPYSQAIDVPLFPSVTSPPSMEPDSSAWPSKVRGVSIAGQIPLQPASMTIPDDADVKAQIALSLQHLWRVGTDQQVQLWTSAVAYFPRTTSTERMQENSRLASRAWEAAHTYGTDGDDSDEEGPDPWDRRYNSEFMSFGGSGTQPGAGASLPDPSVFRSDAHPRPIPPVFSAEVDELPRQSGVEWHAHLGLAGLDTSSVELVSSSHTAVSAGRTLDCHVHHVAVSGVPVRSVVSIAGLSGQGLVDDVQAVVSRAYSLSLPDGVEAHAKTPVPFLMYVDSERTRGPADVGSGGGDIMTGVIPCRSIWSEDGERVAAVALFSYLDQKPVLEFGTYSLRYHRMSTFRGRSEGRWWLLHIWTAENERWAPVPSLATDIVFPQYDFVLTSSGIFSVARGQVGKQGRPDE
ncbi:hypothetical protein ACRALDRAFT_1092517 [Sodiomyces alcalophilus JCM 7366]|uniref:uncharacterized protein n=1 Tax=Sodiomyces alcalophilus JCM 7366 TaxID=591952 RepID=UPI0039B6D1D6